MAGTGSPATDSVGVVSGRPAEAPRPGAWWVGVWGAGARDLKFETRWGTRQRDFYMAGVRVGRALPVSRRLTVDYYVDVVPLLVSTNNPVEFRDHSPHCLPSGPCAYTDPEMVTATARGFGFTPVGLQLRGFPHGRIQPVLGVSLGAAWYDKPVPDPDEQQLNFMGDISASVQIRAGRSSAVVAGIRQHHTSNAGTGRVNPGIEARVLYIGVTRSLGGRSRP